MKLTPVMERFILHWGEMGSRWGVNRTVSQIHALLYLSPRPLAAEEIAETLSVARSNVSTSLRELQNWGLVSVVHVLGDRRDHFETLSDAWDLFGVIVEERKKREIDPTLAMLRRCVAEAEAEGEGGADGRTPAEVKRRIKRMLGFIEATATWYEQIRRLPRGTLLALMKMGARVARLAGT